MLIDGMGSEIKKRGKEMKNESLSKTATQRDNRD